MGKYLTNFKTKEEYEAFRGGDQYITPNVSFIETAGSVINDSYQVPTSGQGGGSASGDGWVYFDLRNSEYRQDFLFLTQACPVFLCGIMEYSGGASGGVRYGTTIEVYNNNNSREQLVNNLYGMAMYLGGMMKFGDMQLTNEEYINVIVSQMGMTNPIDKVPRITKEEFYNLNA